MFLRFDHPLAVHNQRTHKSQQLRTPVDKALKLETPKFGYALDSSARHRRLKLVRGYFPAFEMTFLNKRLTLIVAQTATPLANQSSTLL